MDARITKQRLANMLSYDWLKIVGAIALAAVFFCIFFTMIATRPTDGQSFYVYAYNSISVGSDFNRLEDDLKNKNVFAYDILDTGSEKFSSDGLYGNTVFSARRSAGEGRVMFVSDARTTDENGKESSSLLDNFLDNAGTPDEKFSLFADPKAFIEEAEAYLTTFFGDGLSGELNKENARDAFMKRNGGDKRFRSAAQKEEGVKEEEARLEKLRADFLSVKEAIDGGRLDYVTYSGYEGKEHLVGFSMKSMNMTSLVYYTVEEEGAQIQKNVEIALCIFNNGDREGDLKFETVNFLAYLLRTYGAAK